MRNMIVSLTPSLLGLLSQRTRLCLSIHHKSITKIKCTEAEIYNVLRLNLLHRDVTSFSNASLFN